MRSHRPSQLFSRIPNDVANYLPRTGVTLPGYEASSNALFGKGSDAGSAIPDVDGATYLGCFDDVGKESKMTAAYTDEDSMTNQVRRDQCPEGNQDGQALVEIVNDTRGKHILLTIRGHYFRQETVMFRLQEYQVPNTPGHDGRHQWWWRAHQECTRG